MLFSTTVVTCYVLSAWLSGTVAASYDQAPMLASSPLWANSEELRLVQLFPGDEEATWMTERDKLLAKAQGLAYFDITHTPEDFGRVFNKTRFTYSPPNSTLVADMLPLLSTDEMQNNLEHFTTAFPTRYYNSDSGRASSEWLLAKIQSYTTTLGSHELQELISITPIQHPWKQNSIIIRIAPKDAQETDPITVLGAHCDSINHENPFFPAPGADDDGSGTMTILEAFRGLLKSNYIPSSPVEFHFYSAEEGGGLGSLAVVAAYEAAKKEIKGMIQFDMTAWLESGSQERVNVLSNAVDPKLSEFVTQLVDRYHIHTIQDSIHVSHEFSYSHMLHFSKLALAFAVELSS
ncbi:unnamed protein product [Mycena citricolor]|uniref:Peptide hydrolase n=1 Tax=Mycena citricolor TaxID=2018698 RepID=A0AAD2GQB8_9AGAR|nr:unnamed protein product [Mycena citricolor]